MVTEDPIETVVEDAVQAPEGVTLAEIPVP